jgi:pyrimidine-nucleoside phosphorylase
MSALAMAIYLQGMTAAETATLTQAMLDSGVRLQFPADAPPIVDKHSTGGVGDKVSLILAPLLACCDLWVPMISGRGLGPTGGTLDKLESIPGFRTNLALDEMQQVLRQVGCVINGATAELAPADKKLYALRDVTATVASIPLITASIMSKKLAAGLTALVLDVKCGSGAFMKTLAHAQQLASSLVSVGRRMGVATTALITDMNQPLGRMVGNAVEVDEAMEMLSGDADVPTDLIEITLAGGGRLLHSVERAESRAAGEELLREQLHSGAAREKFAQMVAAQQGNLAAERPRAPKVQITSPSAGVVAAVDTEQLGQAVISLRGGRQVVSDTIDPSVGLEMLVRIGEAVEVGQPLMNLFAHERQRDEVTAILRRAVVVSDKGVQPPPLIVDVL